MLSVLINTPQSPADWLVWSFSHRWDHTEIRQALQAKGGPNLPEYELDPIPETEVQDWLQRNAQTHRDMNQALGLQSSDLLDLNTQDQRVVGDWIARHYLEHYDARAALGI